jgi:hypothetical protein
VRFANSALECCVGCLNDSLVAIERSFKHLGEAGVGDIL